MMRSSTSGVHEWYQTPSGYTTAMGPRAQICRQFALVRQTLADGPTRPNSFRRRLRNSQDAVLCSGGQHLGFVGSAHNRI